MTTERLFLPNVDVGRVDKSGKWKSARSDWFIADPWEKLIAKYERGTTFAYDHYVFNGKHPQRNRITDADIATANALMNANAGATLDFLNRLRAAQDDLEPLLAQVPLDADLLGPHGVATAAKLLSTLIEKTVRGTQLAVASKLLSMKRPHLVPMLDTVVQACLGTSEIDLALQRFADLVSSGDNHRLLEALSGRVAQRYGIPVGRVRVLDQLIWFDWNVVEADEPGKWVVRGFAEGGYTPGRDDGIRRGP